MLKILQAWLQQYVNLKFQMYKLDFKKAEEPEIKLLISICWIIKKAREFQKKKIYFYFFVYTKAFDSVDHNNLWKNS